MELQRNWKRPQRVEIDDMELDYYRKYEPYAFEFQGELFKNCKCIYAASEVKTFKEKTNEILRVAFLLEDGKHYFEHRIWGAHKHSDGTWGDNPAPLQDFLYLCEAQLPHSTEKSVFVQNEEYGDKTYYPLIANQIFSLVIGKAGEKTYNGRTYDTNYADIFARNGLSAEEMQNAVSVPQEWKYAVNRLHKKYCTFKGLNYVQPYNVDKNPLASAPAAPAAPAVAQPTQPVQPIQPVQQAAAPTEPNAYVNEFENPSPFGNPNDDIPF